jgi:PAS domain S-box-containing protein
MNRIYFLALVMVAVAIFIGGTSIMVLYNTGYEVKRQDLVEMARSQARLIEAVSRSDPRVSLSTQTEGEEAEIVAHIKEAMSVYKGFGETGEFVLGRRVENEITFLLQHRHQPTDIQKSAANKKQKTISLKSTLAEPMRRALAGVSGTVVGLDYRGEKVLAAHEPVAELHLGIVAKIDLAEIRAPFLYAAGLIAVVTVILVLGGMILFIRISTPITRQIMESEEKYRDRINSTSEGYCVVDVEGRILEVNNAFCQMLGRNRKELIGHRTSKFSSEESFTNHEEMIANITILEHREYENTFINKLGGHVETKINANSIKDKNGTTVGAFSFVSDVTAYKKSETALAGKVKELDFQKYALDEHAIVSITDIKGNITYVNDKFCEISGYSREELLGNNHRILKSGEHSKEFYTNLWKTISSGKPWHGEIKNRKKNSGEYWVNATIVPFMTEQKKAFRYIAIRTDITVRKESEKIAQSAQKAAENANRSKSEFLANMSHEIRTPMNAIMGMSDLALQTHLDDTQRDYIDKVYRSAESLLGIINDILDFSKIEAGQLDMEMTDFRLEDVLDNLNSILSLKTEDTGVDLTFVVPSKLPTALIGDPLRLGQVLINLGGNAAKFTEAGMIEISVQEHEQETAQTKNQMSLHFGIKDTGIGMSQEQQDRLFKAFNQADSSTTRKYGGTGLGMIISKHLVQMMGGKIWVESADGVGSTVHFTVNMGIQQNVVSTEQHKQEKTKGVNQAIGQLRGARILLVEDNEFNQILALHVLSSNGLTPTLAKDGQQALEILASQDFDGVLMDCQMPVMDGYVTTQEIRKQAKYKDLPILAMTANAMAGDREKVLAAGMNAHIAKPFTRDELFSTMAQWITLE